MQRGARGLQTRSGQEMAPSRTTARSQTSTSPLLVHASWNQAQQRAPPLLCQQTLRMRATACPAGEAPSAAHLSNPASQPRKKEEEEEENNKKSFGAFFFFFLERVWEVHTFPFWKLTGCCSPTNKQTKQLLGGGRRKFGVAMRVGTLVHSTDLVGDSKQEGERVWR